MEEQVKETKKVTKAKKTNRNITPKKTINIKNELKKNAKNIEVEVMNITGGAIFYNLKGEILDIEYPGDTEVVSLSFLDSIKRKGLLNTLDISVVDVYDDAYTVEDVIMYLGISKLYELCDMKLDSIDELLEDTDSKEFEEILKSADDVVVRRLCQRAARLAKENKFDSNNKRVILEELTGNKYIFKSI